MTTESRDTWLRRTLFSVLIAMLAWMSVELFARPTSADVRTMIEREAPYVQDRNWIADDLDDLEAGQRRILDRLDDISDDINRVGNPLAQHKD